MNQRILVMSTEMRTGACALALLIHEKQTKSQRVTLSSVSFLQQTGLPVRDYFQSGG